MLCISTRSITPPLLSWQFSTEDSHHSVTKQSSWLKFIVKHYWSIYESRLRSRDANFEICFHNSKTFSGNLIFFKSSLHNKISANTCAFFPWYKSAFVQQLLFILYHAFFIGAEFCRIKIRYFHPISNM